MLTISADVSQHSDSVVDSEVVLMAVAVASAASDDQISAFIDTEIKR